MIIHDNPHLPNPQVPGFGRSEVVKNLPRCNGIIWNIYQQNDHHNIDNWIIPIFLFTSLEMSMIHWHSGWPRILQAGLPRRIANAQLCQARGAEEAFLCGRKSWEKMGKTH